MSEAPTVRGIVVGHAEVSAGLVGAVRRIAGGPADALVAVSNEGKGPEELWEEIERLAGGDPVVVFVDLATGSCGLAGLRCCRDDERRALVCGVNLPMLLDFVFHNRAPVNEVADRMVEKGRSAIDRPLVGG